ncbi:MAG: helix-turn-helix domain-containing protein [Betaproteobacteria bacterium]|nr:helix-turn-helix domain-containing protein [Betaproteobacteria bacterium]
MIKRYHSALAHRLGRNLAYYRKRAKLTQEQLAEAIQVEVLTISRYETGANLPSLVTLEAVSMSLRVSITDLLSEKALPRSNEEEQCLVMLKSLSPDERSTAMNVLSALVDSLREQRKKPRTKKKSRVDSQNLDQ